MEVLGGGTKGKIIVDTSHLLSTDIVRVQSIVDPTVIFNEVVGTPGDFLIFNVKSDYYKICLVQEISGTPTEMVTINRTIDCGECVYIDVLAKYTLGGIQAIINSHREGTMLSVGDEVTITVDGNDWVMQVGDIDTTNHKVKFVSKNLWAKSRIATSGSNVKYDSPNLPRTYAQTFYNSMAEKDKQYIKLTTRQYGYKGEQWKTYTDYVWIPNCIEATGLNKSSNTPSISYNQFAIFFSQENRVRFLDGTAFAWATTDGYSGSGYGDRTNYIQENGAWNGEGESTTIDYGVLPCFELTADV